MKEYPMTLEEFEKEFGTDKACRDYISASDALMDFGAQDVDIAKHGPLERFFFSVRVVNIERPCSQVPNFRIPINL